MKRAGWFVVFALFPATAGLAVMSANLPAPIRTEVWIGLTLLASFAAAGAATRRPREHNRQN